MFCRYVFTQGLIEVFGSKGTCFININGQVKNHEGNDLPYFKDEDGHKTVNCLSWGGLREYRVIDLVAIHFKPLYIPEDKYNEICAFVIDEDKENTHAKNIGYRFKNGKLEVEDRPGFFYVPGNTGIAIDIFGNCISSLTKEPKKYYVTKPSQKDNSKGGYYMTTVALKGYRATIGRHRALCLVFKDYPNNVDSLVTNHINGIPGDDRLENLEWVTRGGNNAHAYLANLKTQNKKVLVRCVRTFKVTEYYSLAEASRSLGFKSGETIRNRLINSPFGKVFEEGFQLKFSDDARPWKEFEDFEKEIQRAKIKKGLLVRNCLTMEVFETDSVVEAGQLTNINPGSISWRLATKNESPMFGFQFKLKGDETPWVEIDKEDLLKSLRPNSFSIDARNLFTGEKKSFSSIREAMVYFSNNHLRQLFSEGRQPLLESGWQLKMSDWVWEEISDAEEKVYKLQKEVTGRRISDGLLVIAKSAFQMSTFIGGDPKEIRKSAFTRGNRIYRGYQFRLGVSSETWPCVKT